jgi:hypothetical protein
VWSELLGRSSVSARDNFFEIGGDSMLVLRAIARIEQRAGVRIGPRGFVVDTLEQLAAQLPEITVTGSMTVHPARATTQGAIAKTGFLDRVKRRLFGES